MGRSEVPIFMKEFVSMPIISFVRKCVFFSGAVMFGSEVLEVYANLILDWIF